MYDYNALIAYNDLVYIVLLYYLLLLSLLFYNVLAMGVFILIIGKLLGTLSWGVCCPGDRELHDMCM